MYKYNRYWILLLIAIMPLTACDVFDDEDDDDPPATETIWDVASSNPDFETLSAALEATGLDETLDDESATFTVFAPTDAAFDVLGEDTINQLLSDTDTLSDILLYHVVSGTEIDAATAVSSAGNTITMANEGSAAVSLTGDDLYINTSMVVSADIMTDNGVVHVIDAVLMPPAERGDPTNNIVETAQAAGNFTSLVAALEATGLDATLADESATFTVFAPTDAAFDMLGEENVQALLNDTATLEQILQQHVVADTEANSITAYTLNGINVATVGGAEVPVVIEDGSLSVGGATVTTADIYASNGVIHVIDAVIVGDVDLPSPPLSIVDVAAEAGNYTTLVAALEATGLDMTLDDLDSTFTVFAPTDDAFAELGQETIDALLADTATLSDILLYHVISDAEILAADATSVAMGDSPQVTMANDDNVGLSMPGDTLYVNLSSVTSANVMADNGVIHVIDKVLMPPEEAGEPTANIVETAVSAGNFTQLVELLQATGLDDTLSDPDSTFTVFAPTDDAFDAVDDAALADLAADTDALTTVLLQHVVSGAAVNSVTAFTLNGTSVNTAADEDVTIEIVDGELQVQGATVTTFDVYTSNGVIHVIDSVILESVQ